MAAIRLQRFLAQAGIAARRKAEVLITDGQVKVNGKLVTELGTKVDPARDKVEVNGVLVERDDLFYLVLNKPKGCVTTVSDPHDRPTVMDFVFGVPDSVVPIGRLDFYSEGVLLMTNDGALAAALLAPDRHVDKTYHVKIRGRVRREHLEAMRSGVRLDDGRMTRPARVDLLKSPSNHDWLVITLTEGRSRQIHRMAEALGYTVLKLQRVAFAGITYEGLRVGDARELTQAEVSALYQQVGLTRPARATARGTWRVSREQTESARRLRGLAREGKTTRTGKSRTSRAMPGKRSRPARPERKRGGKRRGKPKRR
jgi:23S rRNA pseudouridine2605 synthase